jgi:hypothetical protein
MCYLYNPSNSTEKSDKKKKGGKSKKKKKVGFFTDKRETCILISSILALGTWFLAKTYLCQNNNVSIVDIRGMQNDPGLMQQQNSFLGANQLIGHELGNLNTGQVVQNVPNTMQMNPVNPTIGNVQGNQANAPTIIANPVTVPLNAVPQVSQAAQVAQIPQVAQAAQAAQVAQIPQAAQVGGAINKSYNLIGTGLDIPRSAIPKVLVDYH